MPEGEVPKKRRTRKANHSDNLANFEIDKRLAEAIKERTKLHSAVSRLIYAQEKLSRVEQEINSLVQLQQRLNGAEPWPIPPGGLSVHVSQPPGSIGYAGHATEMPQGITSIPAPRQPKPTTANAGPEVAREGGFS